MFSYLQEFFSTTFTRCQCGVQELEGVKAKYGLNYYPNDPSSEGTTILEETVRLKNECIEEISRLKKELAKHSYAKCENALDKILSIQRRGKGKEGLGYVAKPKKKNQKKKAKPAQAKKNNVVSGNATRGKATHDDFAGNANPHYVLFCDYYGDVYAKYVGPRSEERRVGKECRL